MNYREPEAGPDVRVDTGVYEGGEISMFYDPMIAKLCTYGKNRNAAIDRMRRALDEFYVRGVSHNVPFLAALMAHPRFRAGKLTTNFIAEEFKGGFTGQAPAAARSGRAGGRRRRCRARRATSAAGVTRTAASSC